MKFGSANGQSSLNGLAEYPHSPTDTNSSHMNGYAADPPAFHSHDQRIIDHILQNGFQSGHYADVLLHVHQTTFRLHSLIVSQSPYILAHLSQGNNIYIELESTSPVTLEGFRIALSYLYSSQALHQIQPSNAREALAAACLLGGMEELCSYSYDMCVRSLTPETIDDWIRFVDGMPSSHEAADAHLLGHFAPKLYQRVFDYLVKTLPELLLQEPDGRSKLLHVYSCAPFDLFKAAVESSAFKIEPNGASNVSVHSRFKFVKDCIDLRKRGISRGTDESVVVAFGGNLGEAGNVHITRKVRKRPLYKVS